MTDTIHIDRLGNQGDGVGVLNGKPVFVPFTLPGETVKAAGNKARRNLESIITCSSDREKPFCRVFGQCGGCQLQHMKRDAYLNWKTGLLSEAFSRENIKISPEPIRTYPSDSRRRAALTAKRTDGTISLGFSERGTSDLVDVKTCPILSSELNAVLSDLRQLLSAINPQKGEIRINLLECENGIDLSLTFKSNIQDSEIKALIASRSARSFIRLSINGETVFERQKPLLKTGIALVSPPPDCFVQACSEAEHDMVALVSAHLSKCKKVADLFSGFGVFALKLAENSQVFASETSGPALAAMDRAWRETGGKLKALTHEKRDLFRRPVNAKELKHFDGAVFDPPRAGAEAQAREFAKSGLRKLAAVSCNPQTLARDTSILLDGGFEIVSVTPLDQFAFTPHLETVVLFER